MFLQLLLELRHGIVEKKRILIADDDANAFVKDRRESFRISAQQVGDVISPPSFNLIAMDLARPGVEQARDMPILIPASPARLPGVPVLAGGVVRAEDLFDGVFFANAFRAW